MTKDDATWLKICYVLLLLVATYVGYKAIFTVGLQSGWAERFDEFYPLINNLGGLLFGAGAVYWLASDKERRDYHLSVIGEIRKVTWPTIPDTKRMTLIVVVVVAIFAIILTVFDLTWAKILQSLLPGG